MDLSRRDTLLGTAALAAAPLMTSTPVKAAAPVADKQAPSFYRYKVGDAVVTVISDGKNVFPLADAFITNAKKEDVAAELEKNFMPTGMMAIYFAPLVIKTGGKLVVIDTGNGALAKTNSKGNNGLFARQPGGGRLRRQGGRHGRDLAFPRRPRERPADGRRRAGVPECRGAGARHRVEVLDGRWRDEPRQGRPHGRAVQEQPQHLREGPEQEGHALRVEQGARARPDLRSRPSATRRATPPMCWRRAPARCSSSPMSPTTRTRSRPHPEWHAFFDQDADVAEKTRRRVYDMVVAEKLQVQGFHYPFPGLGNVVKDGDGYRVIPASWNSSLISRHRGAGTCRSGFGSCRTSRMRHLTTAGAAL